MWAKPRAPQEKPLEFFRGAEFLTLVRRTEPTSDRRERSGAREVMNFSIKCIVQVLRAFSCKF